MERKVFQQKGGGNEEVLYILVSTARRDKWVVVWYVGMHVVIAVCSWDCRVAAVDSSSAAAAAV